MRIGRLVGTRHVAAAGCWAVNKISSTYTNREDSFSPDKINE